ncbi:MAG: hypothetical protein JEZ09_17710 [Salinivirgaceae bacterium]|nr:hypothetical protein [Salinivirgaceae bacterium]
MKSNSLLIILIAISLQIFAQEETVTYTQTGDTCIATTFNEYDRMLKYFINEKKEINNLYKIDLFQLALLKPNFNLEHKLTKNSSFEFEASFSAHNKYQGGSYQISGFSMGTNTINIIKLNIGADIKYYYNLNQRSNKGKITTGFSGNYFSAGLMTYLSFYSSSTFNKNNNGQINPNGYYLPFESYTDHTKEGLHWIFGNPIFYESIASLRFGYGLQRRIGNIGYFGAEAKLGIGTNKSLSNLYIMPEINVKAGFAISSFKNLKRRGR